MGNNVYGKGYYDGKRDGYQEGKKDGVLSGYGLASIDKKSSGSGVIAAVAIGIATVLITSACSNDKPRK